MPNSSACRGKKQCAQCPKAVDNAIIYASHPRGFHLPARKCEENIIIFLLKGEVLVNSKEYAGTVLHAGEFILQAIGSKYEILAMTDVECVCYRFSKPEFFCEDRYN
ncbi:MAG: AraC family transcriptional regulator, partial [Bacteroides uniformis]|nr:AraC family transcriptional regulator [Bacteroides uniformis]